MATSKISLNLVVLRSPDITRSAAFYTRVGLQFHLHRHGSGPEHFSSELVGGGVFELYPVDKGTTVVGTRIGFRVPSVDEAVTALAEYPGAVVSKPGDSEWGRRAIVLDPDGNKVELSQL
jgi:catechol 2,3-dioxygenase-like lactoylglutathione lyase family enzyme